MKMQYDKSEAWLKRTLITHWLVMAGDAHYMHSSYGKVSRICSFCHIKNRKKVQIII